jgi:hypothetical protein
VPLRAQTWTTVLNYQFSAGLSSDGYALAADSLGNVFTGGRKNPSASESYISGLVLKTDTTEASWILSDDSNPSPSQEASAVYGLGFDSNGNLYSAGSLSVPSTSPKPSGGTSYCYVRKSSDAGGSWSTVDLLPGGGGTGVAGDLSGNVYVWVNEGLSQWLVRKSADGGQTWATVDAVSSAGANGISFVPGIGLFAVGQAKTTTTSTSKGKTTTTSSISWLVRRSADGGATWSTVDLYQPPPGYRAGANGVASDALGKVYVVGQTTILVGRTAVDEWIVRESGDGGNTWTNVDAFSYAAGKDAQAKGAGRDAAGNIVVGGIGDDANGLAHWLVRRPVQGIWTTVDDYQLASGTSAGAEAIAADAAGNLLVTGYAWDASGSYHWIVRRTNP